MIHAYMDRVSKDTERVAVQLCHTASLHTPNSSARACVLMWACQCMHACVCVCVNMCVCACVSVTLQPYAPFNGVTPPPAPRRSLAELGAVHIKVRQTAHTQRARRMSRRLARHM